MIVGIYSSIGKGIQFHSMRMFKCTRKQYDLYRHPIMGIPQGIVRLLHFPNILCLAFLVNEHICPRIGQRFEDVSKLNNHQNMKVIIDVRQLLWANRKWHFLILTSKVTSILNWVDLYWPTMDPYMRKASPSWVSML